jgi:lipopolysaccharide/colanic/teichoic acid biosynthesis glycosyltransferase
MLKRCTDIILALLALGLLAPLLLAAALAVALETGRPIIFKHQRVGRGGREFGMYKFRSMVKNAARIGPYHTATNDPRVTRVGRFIRKTSIDELPQLINVLRGDMSLVGPRPYVAAQSQDYSAQDWALRHSLRPGITGWAQAAVRSEGTLQESLALDLRYVHEHSLWLDVKIIVMTFARITGKGSN